MSAREFGQRRVAEILADGAIALGSLSAAGLVSAAQLEANVSESNASPMIRMNVAGKKVGWNTDGVTTWETANNGSALRYFQQGQNYNVANVNNQTLGPQPQTAFAITANTTMTVGGYFHYAYDTSGGAFWVKLVASGNLTPGTQIWLSEIGGSANGLTIDLNGNTLDGSAVNPVITALDKHTRIVYVATGKYLTVV